MEELSAVLRQAWDSRLFVDTFKFWVRFATMNPVAIGEIAAAKFAAKTANSRKKTQRDRERGNPAIAGRVMDWMADKGGFDVAADDNDWHVWVKLPPALRPGDEKAGTQQHAVVEIHSGPLAELGHQKAIREALEWLGKIGRIEDSGISRIDLAVDQWLAPGEWGLHLVRRIVTRTRKSRRKSRVRLKGENVGFTEAPFDGFIHGDTEVFTGWTHGSRSRMQQRSYDKFVEIGEHENYSAFIRWKAQGWAGMGPDGKPLPEVYELLERGYAMVRHEFECHAPFLNEFAPPGAGKLHQGESMVKLDRFLHGDGLKWLWRELVGSAREHGRMRIVDPSRTRGKNCPVSQLWERVRNAVEAEPEGGERIERRQRLSNVTRQRQRSVHGQLESYAAATGASFDELVEDLVAHRLEHEANIEAKRPRYRQAVTGRVSLEDIRAGRVATVSPVERELSVAQFDPAHLEALREQQQQLELAALEAIRKAEEIKRLVLAAQAAVGAAA